MGCAGWILFQDGRTRPRVLQRQVPGYQGREARKERGRGQRRRWQYHQERQKRREKGCQGREKREGPWRCQGRKERKGGRRSQRREERKSGRRSQDRKSTEEVSVDWLQPLFWIWTSLRCATLVVLATAHS